MITSIYNYLFTKKDTRFYYLSLIKEENNTFSIHGLWPQNSKTDYPTYCKNVDFSIEVLEPIMDELKNYWYSKQEKNEAFWKHEYQKHGSCMFTPLTELQYFSRVLLLYYKAIAQNLPTYYQVKNGKCLIPVDLDFNFIRI
jgi:ribonuclease I